MVVQGNEIFGFNVVQSTLMYSERSEGEVLQYLSGTEVLLVIQSRMVWGSAISATYHYDGPTGGYSEKEGAYGSSTM